MERKNNKALRIFLTIISIILIVCILSITIFVLVMKGSIHDYYENSIAEFKMPGQNQGLINQGIDYVESDNLLVFVGYRSGLSPSSIYTVNLDTKEQKRIDLLDEKGNTFTGHAGGVCVNGKYIYLAGSSDGCVYVFSYEDSKKCEDKGSIKCIGKYSFKTENDKIRVSFVAKVMGELVVGEYCVTNGVAYNTKSSHHVQTVDGERGGLCVSVKFSDDENSIFGLDSKLSKAYIVPDITQGITSYEGNIYASCSSGLNKSKIYCYDTNKLEQTGTIKTLDTELPLYILDSKSLIKETTVPPMSEEIIVVNNRMYIVTESASSKYVFGKLLGASKIYSTSIEYFK